MNKRSFTFFVHACLMALLTFACGTGLGLEKDSVNWILLVGLVTITTLATLVFSDIINRLEQSNHEKDTDTAKEELDNAYHLVFKDLHSNHPHVVAMYTGTLDSDDIRPKAYEVDEMIRDIVEKGKNK